MTLKSSLIHLKCNNLLSFFFLCFVHTKCAYFLGNADTQKVKWVGVISTGFPVLSDSNWQISKKDQYPIFDGYKSARLIKSPKCIYKVISSITHTHLKFPMYKCQCFPYNVTTKQFDFVPSITLSSLKVTALVNNILHKANVETSHKWQGQTFFGLKQQAVCQL